MAYTRYQEKTRSRGLEPSEEAEANEELEEEEIYELQGDTVVESPKTALPSQAAAAAATIGKEGTKVTLIELPPTKFWAKFSRTKTHNEQILVNPCGVIVARETFLFAESLSACAVRGFLLGLVFQMFLTPRSRRSLSVPTLDGLFPITSSSITTAAWQNMFATIPSFKTQAFLSMSFIFHANIPRPTLFAKRTATLPSFLSFEEWGGNVGFSTRPVPNRQMDGWESFKQCAEKWEKNSMIFFLMR